MIDLTNKRVLVLGLGGRGQATCDLLVKSGARVTALDAADTPELRGAAERLKPLQVDVTLGTTKVPENGFDLAVLSPSVRQSHSIVRSLAEQKIPMMGELELGAQAAKCLCIAIAGTNGKS